MPRSRRGISARRVCKGKEQVGGGAIFPLLFTIAFDRPQLPVIYPRHASSNQYYGVAPTGRLFEWLEAKSESLERGVSGDMWRV